MKYTLDRFEGKFALLEKEDRTMLQVNREALPPEAKEGCMLTRQEENWILCEDDRAARIQSKMNQLWQ